MSSVEKVLFILVLSLSQLSYADTPTQESVERLIDAMGVKESLVEQKAAIGAQGQQAANQMIAQAAVGFDELP